MRRETGGTSVLTLARRIDLRLGGNAQLRGRPWQNLAATLGVEFDDAVDISFSEPFARDELRAIDASTIPCVERPLPAGVLDLRLRVDITGPAQSAPRGQSAVDGAIARPG